MNKPLQGKVAWITGGGTGIGRATAQALAAEGARVVISGRRRAELEEASAAMKAEGLDVEPLPLDVSDAAAVADAAKTIAQRHGPVALLVCCAGLNVPKRFWKDVSLEDYRRVAGVNLDGVVHCVHSVLPGMRSAGDGLIVVISSWAGREFLPIAGMAYGATKCALSPIVESINCEEGRHGVRATLLMPGEVATTILKTRPVPPSQEDLDRMLQPEDLAGLVRYIALAPPRMCVNEVLVGPTWNRIYIGADDMRVR